MYVRTHLDSSEQSARIHVDAGDGLHLWFDDRRVGARTDDRDIALRLTGADILHDLVGVRVRGRVGQLELDERLQPEPHQFFRTTWDGHGAEAGRPYVSDLEIGWDLAARFPRPARTRWWSRRVVCGTVDMRSFGCGGFVPAPVHRLDVEANMVWRGDGSRLDSALTERAAVLANVSVSPGEFAVPDGELVHIFGPGGLLQGTLQARRGRVIATADHDDSGRLTRFSNHGNEFVIEHRPADDGLGGEVIIESPAEVWIGIELDEHGRAITMMDHERHILRLAYDDAGCISTITSPTGLVTEIVRDDVGRVVVMRDSSGIYRRIAGDEGSDLISTTGEGRVERHRNSVEPDGSTIVGRIDGANLARLTEVDDQRTTTLAPNGMVTTTNASTRATGTIPIVVEQSLIEAPSGRKLQVTRESAHDSERLTIGNRVWVQRFDRETNTLTTVEPSGLESTSCHTPGSSLVVTPPGRPPLEIRFDALRRPKRLRRQGTEQVVGYDQYGRLAWMEIDRVRLQVRHDERGRIEGIKSLTGWHRFERSSAGLIDRIENANGATTDFERDQSGRVQHIVRRSTEDSDAVTHLGYDRDGLLRSRRHGFGDDWAEPVEYDRDGAGRVISIAAGDSKVLADHDPDSGELSGLTAANGESIAWTWDGDMCWAEDISGAAPARIERVFDDSHRVAVRSVNRGGSLNYGRHDDGRLVSVGPLLIERNQNARDVVGLRLGSLTTSMRRDDAGRVVAQETRLGRLATLFFAEQIERDRFGRIVKVAEHAQGIDRYLTYSYDDENRLTGATVNGEPLLGLRWDANDNLMEIRRQGRAMPLTYADDDRLLTVAGQPVAQDPSGALLSVGEDHTIRRCWWDDLGQLVGSTDGRSNPLAYRLDPLGRPVDIALAATPSDPEDWTRHRLVWDDDRVAATLGADDELDIRFVDTREHDGAPEALLRDGNEYLLVRDHLGSVRAVIEATSGAVVQALCFDPLGRTLLDTCPGWQPFGFAGGLMDPVGGLVRFGPRVFDPFIGRFLSPRADGYAGSLNRYVFRGADAVNDVRPSHGPTVRSSASTSLGELRVANSPFLFDGPTTPDRMWLHAPTFVRAQGLPPADDALMALRSSWSNQRETARPTFDAVWDPLDACSGRGSFEYQPSPPPPVPGRVARFREMAANPPSLGVVVERVRDDLARIIDGLPD
ncbi:MAG: hypothetical protein AAF567_23600 [Actinomycetota bacterium]